MTERLRTLVGVALALGGIGLAASALYARDSRSPLPEYTGRFLYLTSGTAARRVYAQFDALAADVYWMRTIQHYGRDIHAAPGTNRFELLEPLLDLTTTLDPQFNIAYRFGAIFLSVPPPRGPGRPDLAIALLEKGLRANPRWQYAHDIALIHYLYTGNFAEAARWFAAAAKLPHAPEWIQPLAGVTRAEGGDRQGARRIYNEMLASDQPYIRQWAERGLAQVQALDDVDRLQALVESYHTVTGQYPSGWRDLVRPGGLAAFPRDPSGIPFTYDLATHRVSIASISSLALPDAAVKRP